MLVSESERLRRRVEGLLNFGRTLRPGAVEYTCEYLDPVELVDTVVREFESTGAAPDYSVVTEISEDAPLIHGDSEALSTVVWNLLDNAVKYSPDCRTVWVHIGRDEECASICVRDRGKGIGVPDQNRIFEKYVRGESARHTSGAGLGLAIVRSIVVAHKGTIKVQSEIGVGSSFTVLLPAAKVKRKMKEVTA
jgi:signal transduction histidine kinase